MLNNIILEDIEYIVENINVKKCEGKSFFITGANGFLARYMVEVLIYLNEHIEHLYHQQQCLMYCL